MREHARTVEVFGGRVALLGAGPRGAAGARRRRGPPTADARGAHALRPRLGALPAQRRFAPDRSRLGPGAAPGRRRALRRRAERRPGRRHRGARVPSRNERPRRASRARRRPIRSGDGRRCPPMRRRSRARPAWLSTAAGSARASPPTWSPTGCAGCPPTRSSASATSAWAATRAPCASRARGTTSVLAELTLTDGAAATSGVTRRGWHLIDPSTGRPARTGIVQATALAPTALEAEVRAKAALLAGPGGGARPPPPRRPARARRR